MYLYAWLSHNHQLTALQRGYALLAGQQKRTDLPHWNCYLDLDALFLVYGLLPWKCLCKAWADVQKAAFGALRLGNVPLALRQRLDLQSMKSFHHALSPLTERPIKRECLLWSSFTAYKLRQISSAWSCPSWSFKSPGLFSERKGTWRSSLSEDTEELRYIFQTLSRHIDELCGVPV